MAHRLKRKPRKKRMNVNVKGLFSIGRSIRSKLLFWLLLISLVPMAVIGFVSYKYSAESLRDQSFEQLKTTLAFQKKALEQNFIEQTKQIENIAENMRILEEEAYTKLAAVRVLQKKQVKAYLKQRFQEVQVFAGSPQQQQLFSVFSEDYDMVPDIGQDIFLGEWLESRSFYSLSLINPDGKILYSTDKAIDRGAFILENTAEWRGLQKGIQETGFIDYGKSSFDEGKYVAYFATPLVYADQSVGVLLFRLKDNALDDIMKDAPGLGENGESYLVGVDGMFRSNSRHFEEITVANPSFLIDNESIVDALSGEDGEDIVVNYRGDYVLSAYTSVDIYGTRWVLMVEIDQGEAVVPKVQEGKKDHLEGLAGTYNFPDLYLISPDGHIFASAAHKNDYLTNILTGPYSDSMFGRTVGDALETKGVVLSDYSFYKASEGKPVAFMAVPIRHGEEIVMIVALQISIDRINEIMDVRQQFEREFSKKEDGALDLMNVATYLIGSDKLWRSEARNAKKYNVKTTLLEPKAKVDTVAVNEALTGKNGTEIILNSVGENVLSSWAPVRYKGLQWAIISEISQEEIERPITALMRIIGLLALLAMAAVIIVSLLVAGDVTKQVAEIMHVMAKVETGEYGEQAKVTSKDELGRMALSFNTMTATIQELVESRQKEHDQLQDSIIQLLEEITDLADGDLSIRATVTEDVIGTLADSLNMMLEELGTAFGRIKQSAEQVGSTANILSASTGELADQNNNQASMINEAAEEINLLTKAIQDAAEKADQSAATSKDSSQVAEDGAKAVRDTSQAMEAIRGNVQNTARAMKRLGESSQEISDFARTINEISDRTSILALNASIQAAAAGEEGRGFAVVAEEIQRLAERAAVSTRQIETLIKNILGEITEAGVSMDASIQEVVQGTKLSQNALARLEEITDRSDEVVELIHGVAVIAKQQADTTAVLSTSMGEIGTISLETAEETMGASVSMQEMAVMGDDMLKEVSTFKLEAEADEVIDALEA
ncbi:MAG: methyl-accepting chemotaxis protein [Candidatus Electrothrix sp. AR4]|nr:methyl-accepting chemotaxis protein [Candidatus Electrothrix sp. AR4]